MKKTIAVFGTITLGVVLLAGCGNGDMKVSSTPGQNVTEMPSLGVLEVPGARANREETMVGANSLTWTPIMITQEYNNKTINLEVEQIGVFIDLPANDETNNIVVESSKPDFVGTFQSTNKGDLQTNAGVQGFRPGTAKITVWDGTPGDSNSIVVMVFSVKVGDPIYADGTKPADGQLVGADPATWSPVEVGKEMVDLRIIPGQNAIFTDTAMLDGSTFNVISSDMAVIKPATSENGSILGFSAVRGGFATVAVVNANGDIVQTVNVTIQK